MLKIFVDDAEITGKTADAIRSYLSDVHMTILSSLQTAAQSMLDNIAVYKAGYYEIDASTNFVLSEEVMEEFRAQLVSRYDATEICGNQIENVLASISDLFTVSRLDKNQVPETHEQMDHDIIQLKEAITSHESMMVQALENSTEPLIHLLESSINKAGSNTADVGDYESGKFYANTDVDMLKKLSQYLDVQHENNKEIYDKIWDAEKQIKTEEEANDGIWETIFGVGTVIAGGLCIVATAGAATPLVVAAGGIAGGGTMLFGMSNTTEGIQHIYYGKTGNVSSIAMNPLRDSVFNGNDKAYRMAENVFEFSSSVLPIAGMASKAGKAVLDMGVKGAKSAEGKSISEIAKGGSETIAKTQKNIKIPVLPEGSQWERNVLNSFAGGKSTPVTYKEGTTLYRIGGKNGGFWSLDPPPVTEYQWRVDFAIKQEFCNDASTLYKMTVPKGSTISGLEGTVGTQGMGLYGGAHQVYIDYRAVPKDWIEISPTIWK